MPFIDSCKIIGEVPAAQALVQPPAAPANVDTPLQELISFLVICSLDCLSFSPIRLHLVIPRGPLLVPFSSLRKHRVSVVLLFSLRPLSQFAHVLSLFVMLLCAWSHKHQVCVVLLIPLRLPYPVCTRFICHVLCASPHTIYILFYSCLVYLFLPLSPLDLFPSEFCFILWLFSCHVFIFAPYAAICYSMHCCAFLFASLF